MNFKVAALSTKFQETLHGYLNETDDGYAALALFESHFLAGNSWAASEEVAAAYLRLRGHFVNTDYAFITRK